MRKIVFLLPFFLFSINIKAFSKELNTSTLKGKVTDENNKPVSFANITLQELSVSTSSDLKGVYIFTSLPQGIYHLNVTRSGYMNRTLIVNLNAEEIIQDIFLEKSLIETPTIDVTSSFNPTDISNSTFAITSLGPRTLTNIRSQNIASTIQNVPGINNLSTGSSIGKPVIRGLTSQSVLIVHDGVKHESQQWGDEHGPEVSVFNIDRIEIMRGPASLIYGADGIGGVINIISKPLLYANSNKSITYGSIDLNGFSVNTEGAGDLILGLGTKNFSIKGYAGYRKGENIKTPAGEFTVNTPEGKRVIEGGELSNSGNEEFEGGAIFVVKGNFGNINGAYEIFNRKIQIHGDPAEDPNATPNQKIVTDHFELRGNFFLKRDLQLEPVMSYENQIRKEFESKENTEANIEALHLDLKIFQGDLRLHHKVSKDLSGTIGGSVMNHDNKSLAAEKLIPNYDAFSYGVYLTEKFEKKYFTVSGGIRYDNKKLNTKETIFEVNKNGQPERIISPNELSFDAVTGSFGIVYKPLKELDLYGNIGRGWRPPSEFELYVDGVHEGTGRFDRGLITLDSNYKAKPEESFNIDIGTRIRAKYFNGEISFFRNLVNNFIYPSPTTEIDSVSGLPVFDVKQDESSFIGFEYNLQVHPVKWLLLTFKGDYVDTKNKVTGNALPFTPPSKNSIEVKIQKENLGNLYNPYINFATKLVSSQTKVDPLEAETDNYTLLSAGLGFDFVLSKSIASVDFSVSNLTNTKYVDHLSRYKYYALNPARSFNLKISVPFQFESIFVLR